MDFLNGIRVIEFSHMVMGPALGMMLADLGAEVIKIEPLGGDKTRRLSGSGAGYFPMFNRNKKSICVDLKSDAGREIAYALVKSADVVCENFRAGALDKLGLGVDDLHKINPDLIYQSCKGFLSGPYQERTALDEVAQMMGGLAYMTGPSGRPLRAGASVIDITGAMAGAIGVLAALFKKANGAGEAAGHHITSSLFETTAFLVGQHIAQHAVTGTPAAPMPERVSAWAVYDVFDTTDRRVFVAVVSDGQWKAFCERFELDDWRDDPAYATNAARVARRDAIVPRLRALFKTFSSQALARLLEEAGLPFAPIQTPDDLLDDPHLANGGLHDVTLPDTAKVVRLPALPLEVDGARAGLRRNPPEPGADTRSILAQLGYSQDAIRDLFDRRLVG